jgi:protein SCO1/2
VIARGTLQRPWTVGPSLVVALVGALGCSPLADEYNGRRVETPVAKPAIPLSRIDGMPFDVARETDGRLTLLYFGYSNCPDICPIQLTYLAAGMRMLGADSASQLRVMVVSIDPARDTGAVFGEWVGHFHRDFIALRGEKALVDAEITRLGLEPPAEVIKDSASVDPAHASAVMLFGADGIARFIYPANTTPEQWVYDLRKLLAGGGSRR